MPILASTYLTLTKKQLPQARYKVSLLIRSYNPPSCQEKEASPKRPLCNPWKESMEWTPTTIFDWAVDSTITSSRVWSSRSRQLSTTTTLVSIPLRQTIWPTRNYPSQKDRTSAWRWFRARTISPISSTSRKSTSSSWWVVSPTTVTSSTLLAVLPMAALPTKSTM